MLKIRVEVLKLTNLHLVGSNRVFLLFSGSQRFQFFLVGHSSFLLVAVIRTPSTSTGRHSTSSYPVSGTWCRYWYHNLTLCVVGELILLVYYRQKVFYWYFIWFKIFE